MRSVIRVLAAVGAVGLTIYGGRMLFMGFGAGNSQIQGEALKWMAYAVGAWCVFWWAGQSPK